MTERAESSGALAGRPSEIVRATFDALNRANAQVAALRGALAELVDYAALADAPLKLAREAGPIARARIALAALEAK